MTLDADKVENTLLVWEKTFANGKTLVDFEVVDIWVATLNAAGVTTQEFSEAALKVQLAAKFFPKPAEVIEQVQAIRDRRKDEAQRRYWASLVETTDANGVPVLVPGDSPQAIQARQKALPAAPATEEQRRARILAMTPQAAVWLIHSLKAGGQDTTVEAQALKDLIQRTEAQEAKDREAADAEQAQRVRAQIEAVKRAKSK